MDQLAKDTGDMCVLVCNLKEQEHHVGPTAHAPVLLMATQKFMRAMLEIENVFEPSWPFTMRSAQFLCNFVQNSTMTLSQSLCICMSHFMFWKRCRRDRVPNIYSSATASRVSRMPHVLMCCWQVWCATVKLKLQCNM